jgi:hypothetical protein
VRQRRILGQQAGFGSALNAAFKPCCNLAQVCVDDILVISSPGSWAREPASPRHELAQHVGQSALPSIAISCFKFLDSAAQFRGDLLPYAAIVGVNTVDHPGHGLLRQTIRSSVDIAELIGIRLSPLLRYKLTFQFVSDVSESLV